MGPVIITTVATAHFELRHFIIIVIVRIYRGEYYFFCPAFPGQRV